MDNLSGPSVLIVAGIWSIVFIGYFVWYLWSLSRLFPKIGLPSWAGWVPVWNQWQLVQRGGLPGWLVLLGLIPFLGVVVLVVLIIAINRINSEHGKGAGFTVLGVVLPPLWAMLLANHIRDTAYAGPGAGSARPLTPSGIPGFGAQPTHGDQGGVDWQGLPPVPPQAYQQQAPQQPFGQQPATQQQFAQQQAGQQQFGQQQQPQQQTLAQPQSYQQPQPVQPQQPSAQRSPQEQLWAEPARQQVPPAPQPPQVQPQQAPVQHTPVPPAPPAPPAPVNQVPPAPAAPAPSDNWGFSNTTEGAFERLAAEEAQRGGRSPLGAAQAQRQFSWPSPEPDENAELAARSPLVLPEPPEPPAAAPPVVQAPRVAQTPPAVQESPADQVTPAAAPPAPHTPPARPEATSEEAASVSEEDAPLIFDTGGSRRPATGVPAAAPEHTGTASAVPTSTGTASTANTASAPNAAAAATAAAAASAVAASAAADDATSTAADSASHDEELDRTVVVVRRTRWGLELPDGEVLELLSDDVVLGRKPEAPEGASVLQIVDPTRTMSKTHARLRRDGEDWTIEDLQSTNGVAVIDDAGQATQIEASRAVPATPRLVIGTLEVKLQQMA